jgi:hypothetical protein
MIPGITEIGFPSYATLHQATVHFEEMGDRTITTQVRIDGSVVPDFSGWALEFRGERFVLPTLKPQASKDNSTKNALVDLVFSSSAIHELKRFYFAEMAQIDNGTVIGQNIIDKYVATLRLSLTNFVAAFNKVLQYYFPAGGFIMNLNPNYQDSGEVKEFEIDYMYIWDVLLKINEVYGVTWKAVRNSQGVTVIRVGYDSGSIPDTDHVFQYGFEGGLLRFERHVEDTDIFNVLLGRGGEQNIPYRYFKYTDQFNPIWNADPDAIHELRTVYFSRLLDSNFRSYVQGWKTNPRRVLEDGESVETYDASRGATDWAYKKGHDDTKFDPVEYVKDDESIELYGIRQGRLEDNDDIFPTIQGVSISPMGRVDEVVDVYITDEDSQEAIYDLTTNLPDLVESVNYNGGVYTHVLIDENTFTVPQGRVGNIEYIWKTEGITPRSPSASGTIDTINSIPRSTNEADPPQLHRIYGVTGLGAGTYRLNVLLRITRDAGDQYIQGKFGLGSMTLHCTPPDKLSYRQVFTIWVKNIWQTTQGANETDLQYAHRVWDPILGDKLGQSAAVCFSDGWMSGSEDYEFLIQRLPEVDRTKTRGGVSSEWKITLVRSDAEYEATGLYTPNTKTGGVPVAGDHFFFTGIDIPIQYVKWAEERLTQSKEDALQDNAWTNPTWLVSLDKIKAHQDGGQDYAGTLAEKLDAGVQVTITDPRFTVDANGVQQQLTLGVRSVTFTWNEPTDKNPYVVPDIEIVLSDKIVHIETYQGVKREVTYISRNYATNSSVRKMSRQSSQTVIAEDTKICYLGPVIGTVEI